MSEYVVPARTVAICVPPLYIRYPATAILSVEALHERLIWDAETAVAVRPVGTVGDWVSLKEAVTETGAEIEIEHGLVPEHAPDQPAKVEPDVGVAVRVTEVPLVNDAEQVEPHEMPDGFDEMVPAPVPDRLTERAKVGMTLFTVTDIVPEVVVFPAPSRAVAVKV